jgi:DNA-binding XRE family transcriptional regulator
MNNQHGQDVLSDSWTIDPNDKVVTLTDALFTRADHTPEIEARTVVGLVEMERKDVQYKERLADLRLAIGLTQTDVASQMGVSQSGIAAIESPTDIRISTLARYLEAIGGHGELVVKFFDHTRITIDLQQLVPEGRR